MTNVLITGVAGLIGSRLANWIIENIPDVKVIGVDDLSGGYIENVNSLVEFHKEDVKSEELEKLFIEHRPEYVFHLSAYAAEGLSPFIRKYNYENNLLATANIINNCIKYETRRLVFTSSLAVYGHGVGGYFDEKQVPSPIDPYGVAKFACEMDIQIAGEQHGLDWCIIRPHNVYGVNQNIWDKYRNVIGIWMYQHMRGEPMTIFGDGEQKRAFSFIDDILEPLWNAAIFNEASKEIINLGGVEEYSINETCSVLSKIVGKDNREYLAQRHEVKYSVPTWEKSMDILNFSHSTSLREGIEKMWEWARLQPERPRMIWENYELEKGIYSYWKK
jgi:UDP-glucose 4-epimerase